MFLLCFQEAKRETVSKVIRTEQLVQFALRGGTAAGRLSRAADKPAPSGTWPLLHPRILSSSSPDPTGSSTWTPHGFCLFIDNKKRRDFPTHVPPSLCGRSRWRADPWPPCSATCGGGSQTRTVRCMKGPESRSREVGGQHCHGTGRRPSSTRLCNQLPCSRWATTQWGLVSLHWSNWFLCPAPFSWSLDFDAELAPNVD